MLLGTAFQMLQFILYMPPYCQQESKTSSIMKGLLFLFPLLSTDWTWCLKGGTSGKTCYYIDK